MGESGNGRIYECVAIDLNTQYDFCAESGSSLVSNIDGLLPELRRVVAWLKRNQAPVVSAIDSHRSCEIRLRGGPSGCIDGTFGQRKIEFTVFSQHTLVEIDNTLCLPLDLFESCQQVIFRKRSHDLLLNPKADRFLTQIPTLEFLVFGNTLEESVKSLVLGLRARLKKVTVIIDACGFWNMAAAEIALRQMCAKGAQVTTVNDLLARRLARRYRYPLVKKNGPCVSARPSSPGAKRINRRITVRCADGQLPQPIAPARIRSRKTVSHRGGVDSQQPPWQKRKSSPNS